MFPMPIRVCAGQPCNERHPLPDHLLIKQIILKKSCSSCPSVYALDSLAMSAIRFLTTVSKSVHHKLFADAATLQQICESIVIPNLRVREDDQEVSEGGA